MPDRVATSGPIASAEGPATGDSISAEGRAGMSSEVMLMLLADARLPTGAHTQSAGLEPALRGGMPPAQVPQYIRARLRTVTTVEAGAAVLARAAVIALAGQGTATPGASSARADHPPAAPVPAPVDHYPAPARAAPAPTPAAPTPARAAPAPLRAAPAPSDAARTSTHAAPPSTHAAPPSTHAAPTPAHAAPIPAHLDHPLPRADQLARKWDCWDASERFVPRGRI